MAERDVAVRMAVEDAPLRLFEGVRVVVRRPVREQDDVAGGDRLTVELDVVPRVATDRVRLSGEVGDYGDDT